jgi:Ni/Fe-hydrogenase subunit HybB-like protein
VIHAMTPDTLGEMYDYVPSLNEILVTLGILSIGALMLTFMVKIATPILNGEFLHKEPESSKEV